MGRQLCWESKENFLGNKEMSNIITSFAKIWGASLSKAVFIKKVNILWMFIKKAFPKTSKPVKFSIFSR